MPSHISHALLAEDVAGDVGALTGVDPAPTDRLRAILVTGAQGPDFFLHNHRRKPRGFRYGALLHRKGNAPLLASLAHSAATGDREDLSAYAVGYITHVWLDRLAHPYINWSAGWRGTPDSHPDRPAMHAFLERLIDVQYLRRHSDLSVAQYRFVDRLPRRAADFFRMRPALVDALRAALVSAADDSQLPRRLLNALHDGLGFYRYTEAPPERYFVLARHRERRGEVSSRWLSLVHPPESLISVDALNREHREWAHPCDDARRSRQSFEELVAGARERSVRSVTIWQRAVDHADAEHLRAILDDIGPENLNDGIVEDPPCRRTVCAPLPLIELYEEIKLHFERHTRA